MWQIVDIGEFLEAPEELSPTGSAKLTNVMEFLVRNGVYSVAQYLLNTAINAGHYLMWNGVPLENNNIDLEKFFQSPKE